VAVLYVAVGLAQTTLSVTARINQFSD